MRDIKFRAWDKKRKGFINGCNMFGFTTGQGCPKKILKRFSNEWNEGDFELMQYTGLKDKNGKEIYEGDIVGFEDCISTENGYSEQGCIGVVEWSHETVSFEVSNRLWAESYEVLGECLVIGNIYENPELLGGE